LYFFLLMLYKTSTCKTCAVVFCSTTFMLATSAIDCGYELRSCQTKEYQIGMCCFSAKNAALRRKNKDWLARNQNNVSEWSDISTQWLLLAHLAKGKVSFYHQLARVVRTHNLSHSRRAR
jgi:hypothetical protein